MRKLFYIIFSVMALSAILASCNNGETYAERLEKEKKAIKRFINDNGIITLNSFPADSIFGEKEYYLHPSGTYIRVIKYGDKSRKATQNPTTDIQMRASAHFIGDTLQYSNFGQSNSANWVPFTFGNTDTYSGSYSQMNNNGREYYKYIFMSVPCTLSLDYVGDQGEVSLIVPFVNGSAAQTANYKALYFDRIRYTIDK